MCGIIGLVGSSRPNATKVKEAMLLIANRGPDYHGDTFINNCVWFGHARLAILDLTSAGNQPYQFQNLTLTFNGMIYNHKSIRFELDMLGYKFRSCSDTEVLIKAWHCWGEKALDKMDGFFAFSIYDSNREELFLCTDHISKKPLYWRRWKGGIAFASRLDALEAITEKQPLNREAVPWLFTLKYIPAPLTAVEGIFKLERGNILTFKKSDITIKRWSKTYGLDQLEPEKLSISSNKLKASIIAAVEKRLEADVPVCTLLSGGLDSTIVTTLASRMAKIESFTLAIQGEGNEALFNEAPIASLTATSLGIKHHVFSLSEVDVLSSLEGLFSRVFDEPFADPASLLNHLIFEKVSSHFKVCLTGDGADELFGGYRRHQGHLMYNNPLANNWLMRKIGPLISSILPDRRDSAVFEKIRLLRRYLETIQKASTDGRIWLCRPNIYADDFTNPTDVIAQFEGWQNEAAINMDAINSLLSAEMQWTIPGQMMVKTDRTSMDVGVEVRSPFLDREVIENAFTLPGIQKLQPNRGKAILREVFFDDLPSNIFEQRKRGFELPLQAWLNGPFAKYIENIKDCDFLNEIGLKPGVVNSWTNAIRGKQSSEATEHIWTLIGLHMWIKNR